MANHEHPSDSATTAPAVPPGDPMDMVCRDCLEPLNNYRYADQPGQVTWLHRYPFIRDHPPQPVPRADAPGIRLICDFCSAPGPVWSYHTREEVTDTRAQPTFTGREHRQRFARHWQTVTAEQGRPDERLHNIYSPGWATCQACADLIEIRDMQRLITRVRRHGPPQAATVPRNAFRDLWSKFFGSSSHREPIQP